MEKEEFLGKALAHEVVKKRVASKMAELIEKVALCNKHLKNQGSNDRMTIEDVIDKFPDTTTPGVQLIKAAFSVDEMVNEAYKIYLQKNPKELKNG